VGGKRAPCGRERERGDDVASQLMQQQKELWQKQQQFAAG